MKFFHRLFGGREGGLEQAKHFLDEAERLADDGNPLYSMEYIARESRGLQPWIGPDGPLHDRFVSILHKVKSRVFASNPEAPPRVQRNWENLPSVLQIPLLGEGISVAQLIAAVRSSNKDLVWLVPARGSVSQQDGMTMIDYAYHFADNPRLAVQFHQWNGNVIIRGSFFLEIAPQLGSPTVGDLLVDVMRLATGRGLAVETI